MVKDENAEVLIQSKYYWGTLVFVKKGNRAWRYEYEFNTSKNINGDFLWPAEDVPLREITKMMLWEETAIINYD